MCYSLGVEHEEGALSLEALDEGVGLELAPVSGHYLSSLHNTYSLDDLLLPLIRLALLETGHGHGKVGTLLASVNTSKDLGRVLLPDLGDEAGDGRLERVKGLVDVVGASNNGELGVSEVGHGVRGCCCGGGEGREVGKAGDDGSVDSGKELLLKSGLWAGPRKERKSGVCKAAARERG